MLPTGTLGLDHHQALSHAKLGVLGIHCPVLIRTNGDFPRMNSSKREMGLEGRGSEFLLTGKINGMVWH